MRMSNRETSGGASAATPQVMDWARRQPGITSYERDQTIFYRGHRPMGLHIILEGSVALQDADGQEPTDTASPVGPGWILGLHGLLAGRPYSVSAIAREECRIAFIDKTAFERALAADGAPLRELLGQPSTPGPLPRSCGGRPLACLCAALMVLGSAVGLLLAETAPGGARDQGAQLFQQFQCFACHGPQGKGGVKNPNAVGGEVPALTRVAEGYTVSELKRKIQEGVPTVDKQDPDGPDPPLFMPAWKGVLNDEQTDSLTAYLLSLTPKTEKGEEW